MKENREGMEDSDICIFKKQITKLKFSIGTSDFKQ